MGCVVMNQRARAWAAIFVFVTFQTPASLSSDFASALSLAPGQEHFRRAAYALATRDLDPLIRALEDAASSGQRPVGPIPPEPRRTRPWPAWRILPRATSRGPGDQRSGGQRVARSSR